MKREDIERYRRVLQELGGEASLEEIAKHADEPEPYTDLGYIAACLIVPVPTQRDPSIALPSAWGSDRLGRRMWRTEPHWTSDDLEAAQRFLRPDGGSDDDDRRGG